MTRTISTLFFILFLVSCGKEGGSDTISEVNVEELTNEELLSDTVPIHAETFQVNASLSGFGRNQEEKIYKSIDLIKQVVGSSSFKKMILQKTYNGKKQFVDNNGLTNSQIYTKILAASEKLTPGKNNAMDIKLEGYYDEAIVIGYTMPNIQTIYLNTRYLDKSSFKENEVAMNLTHEWLHKLGFGHAQKDSPSRPHSVPYAIGYIMRKLAGQIK